VGYPLGASIGIFLAAVITQFPFAEKIIVHYIRLPFSTPMLALVLLLNAELSTQRIIAVSLAAGHIVMINSATSFPGGWTLVKLHWHGITVLQHSRFSTRSASGCLCQW
jgi:hypothetical protein